jgi:hypothetical protein
MGRRRCVVRHCICWHHSVNISTYLHCEFACDERARCVGGNCDHFSAQKVLLALLTAHHSASVDECLAEQAEALLYANYIGSSLGCRLHGIGPCEQHDWTAACRLSFERRVLMVGEPHILCGTSQRSF